MKRDFIRGSIEGYKMGHNRIGRGQRVGEDLVKRRNGKIFYYFDETKRYRGIGFHIRGKYGTVL